MISPSPSSPSPTPQMKVRKVEFTDPPTDTITSTIFLKSDSLCTTSWDSTINIYNPEKIVRIHSVPCTVPLLDSCYDENTIIYSAGIDGNVYM